MYPRQSLTPRCSAKPARHSAHPDVDPHAVSKRQLALRLSMKIDDDANDFDNKSARRLES